MASSSASSSESASSSGSSSGSRSQSPAATPSSSKVVASPANTSHTSSYIPPRHFEPAVLPDDLSASSLKNATRDGKQLWIIKVPEDVHPSLLDGLVFDVPDVVNESKGKGKKASSKGGSNGSLGSLKISRRDEETGEKQSKDVYRLFHSTVKSTADIDQDAKNAKAGLSSKKAKKDGSKSQLVSEQEDGKVDGSDGFAAHMTGLRAYLSYLGGRPGQISAAPLPVSQHLEFVLAPPEIPMTATSDGTTNDQSSTSSGKQGFTSLFVSKEDSKSAKSESRNGLEKHGLRELKGFFAPSGSLFDEEKSSVGASQLEPPSMEKARKKRKKDEADLANHDGEADPTASSPLSKASKKSKVKKEDGEASSTKKKHKKEGKHS